MLASHAFRPRISVRSRKAAVDSAFISPLYRGRVGIDHGVFHVAASCVFAASFHRCFHLNYPLIKRLIILLLLLVLFIAQFSPFSRSIQVFTFYL